MALTYEEKIEIIEKTKNTEALTPKEKQFLVEHGIPLVKISGKYHAAKRRALQRGSYILPKNAWYRHWIFQAKILLYEKKITSLKEALNFEVHSQGSYGNYLSFELLTKEAHRALHQDRRREEAKNILKVGKLECKHCHAIKPLEDFPKSTQALIGRIRTCKMCSWAMRKANKAFKAEVA